MREMMIDQTVSTRGDETAAQTIEERFERLCRAGGFEPGVARKARQTFEQLVTPHIAVPKGARAWESEVGDDGSPVEFSVAFSGSRCEVRVLFEPQGQSADVASYRRAALDFHALLEKDYGVDLQRLRLIEDLFAPEDMQGPFAIWSSIVFRADGTRDFKCYLNPQARGAVHARSLVEQGLKRLGFDGAWQTIAEAAAQRGPDLDELKYFALDLDTSADARVKVYVRHHAATPEDLEQACSAAREYVPGESLEFARAMGGGQSRMRSRATFTCSALTTKDPARPQATTLYVPVCAYAPDDAEVRRRVSAFLGQDDESRMLYEHLLDVYPTRKLEAGVGLQSWMAMRRTGSKMRWTVYLSTESRKVYPPGTVPAPTSDMSGFLAQSTGE